MVHIIIIIVAVDIGAGIHATESNVHRFYKSQRETVLKGHITLNQISKL
jgi:hypothetical protein